MYQQPDFYRFSEDSTELVKFALREIPQDQKLVIADFGCGSGIIAIEFAMKFQMVSEIYFIEVQPEFLPYLKENLKMLPKSIKIHIVNKKFSELKFENRIDIAFSNPPYFKQGSGRVSQDKKRQKCRTFEIDNLELLLEKIQTSLVENGLSYIVLREEIEDKNYEECKRLSKAIIYKYKK